MSDLISNLQRLGDAEHDDLSVAHDALAEIVRLRILTVEQHDEIERLRQWELVGREWLDKTDWMQSRDAPVRWLGKHRADALREEIERLTAERDEARAERDALRIELDVCRSAIEDCYDIVETFDCYNDSDDACQRVTLRRLNEAIGKAAPRLLHERPEGQKLYGLRYRELIAERDALHAVATDAHRDIDELRRQLAEAKQDGARDFDDAMRSNNE